MSKQPLPFSFSALHLVQLHVMAHLNTTLQLVVVKWLTLLHCKATAHVGRTPTQWLLYLHSLTFFLLFQPSTHTAHASDGKSPYTVLSWDSLSRQYFHCLALGLEGYCLNLHFSLALTYLLPFFVRSACTRLPQPSWLWAIRQQHQQQQSSFYGHYTGQPASAGTYS